MPKILVDKAFNLILRPNSDKLSFEPGLHDVSDDVAAHWYVRENATILDGNAPVLDTANSDGRRALIERLVGLFRAHIETLSIETLAEMLERAEAQQAAASPEAESAEEPAPAPAPEPEAEAEAVPETEQVAETVEPKTEVSEPQTEQAAAEFDPALVDAMTDDELRAYITKRDKKAPHHKLGHDKLVALALSPAAGETVDPQAESAEA